MSFRITDVPMMRSLEHRILVECRTWTLVGGKMNICPMTWRLVALFHSLDNVRIMKRSLQNLADPYLPYKLPHLDPRYEFQSY
jgi:hypothetical protein